MGNLNPIPYLVGFIAVLALLLLGGCLTFGEVPVGYNGVEECASTLTGKVLGEGWHNKAPWCGFDNIAIGNRQFKVEKVTVHSRDNQAVTTDYDITWEVNPSHLVDIQRKYHGSIEEVVFAPNALTALRQSASLYTVADLTTIDLINAQNHMESILRQRLSPYNNDFTIVQLSLTNFEPSSAWQSAVEQKVVAGQNLLTQETNLKTKRVEADQTIATARGTAQAQALQKRTLSPLVVQEDWITKWDGRLPTVTGAPTGAMLSMGSPFASESKEH